MKPVDVVVVGGGVIGLSIAYALAVEGVNSTVLDRGEMGKGASWAGAGMIPPHTERLNKNPTVELRSWSALLYPDWSSRLLEETGIDNGYRKTGGVDVAATLDEENELKTSAGRWRAEKIVYERLAPERLRPGRARAQSRPPPGLLPARPGPDPKPPTSPGARRRARSPRGHTPAESGRGRIRAVE